MSRSSLLRPLLAALVLLLLSAGALRAEDGYELWLRYPLVSDAARLREYRAAATEVVIDAGGSATLAAARDELRTGLGGLLGQAPPEAASVDRDGALLVGTPRGSRAIAALSFTRDLRGLGDEGYEIRTVRVGGHRATVIVGNTRHRRALRRLRLPAPAADAAAGDEPGARERAPPPAAHARPLGQPRTAPSSAATPAAPSGTGTSCPAPSTRATATTPAPTPPSASTAPSSTTSTPTRRSSPTSTWRRSPRSPTSSGPTASGST